MDLIPFRGFTLKTNLAMPDAIAQLRKNLFTKSPPVLYMRGPLDFYGRIIDSRFTAHRLLDYRGNAFIPMLHGLFVQTPTGTEIQVKMHPPIINLVIASLLFSMPFVDLLQSLIQREPFGQNFGLLLIPVIICGMVIGMFNPEAKRAEKFLKDVYMYPPDEQITNKTNNYPV